MSRRLFYAIEFPEQVRSQLAEFSRLLAGSAHQGRWVRPDNFHLTLQFLGDCPDEWLGDLSAILAQAAESCPEFEIKIAGCGSFGPRQEILWIGVLPNPGLSSLVGRLAALLRQKGLPCEDRPFAAHITIGRQVRIEQSVLREWNQPVLVCPVSQVTLMESTRIQDRLTYLPLRRESLRG